MDYFTELLESYSKLKKRNLKLLEAEKKKANKKAPTTAADPKPKPKVMSKEEALEAAKNAPYGGTPPQWHDVINITDEEGKPKALKLYKADPKTNAEGQPTTSPDAEKQVKLNGNYIVADNAVRGGGRATIIDAQGMALPNAFDSWYERNFPGHDQVGGEDTSTTDQVEAAEGRAGRQFEKVGLDDPTLNSNMVEMLQRVTKMAQVARGMGIEEPWVNPARTENYVTGASPQSMERKLAQGTIATWDEEEGFQTGSLAVSSNLNLLVGATFSLNQLLSFGTNDVTDINKNSRCRQLEFQVRKKGDKYVFHTFGDLQEGIVMGDSELLDQASKRVNQICGKEITQIPRGKLEGEFTAQQIADYRGTGLEVTFAGATFWSVVGNMPASKQKQDELRKRFGSYTRQVILKDQSKFVQAHKWARELVDSGVATDMDSDFAADAILALGEMTDTPTGLKRFFSTALALEEAVIETVKPDMSIPVGKETGAGIVDDLKYIYVGENAAQRAQQASDNLGLLSEHEDPVEKMTMGELKKLNPEVAEIYQEGYGLSDEDVVYSVGSGIKSYQSNAKSKAGEIKNYWRRSAIVHGTESRQVAEGFDKVTLKRLGLPQTELKEIRGYQTELDKVYSTLDEVLPDDATAMTVGDGTIQEINFDTVFPILKNTLGNLPQNSKIRTQLEALFNGPNGVIDLREDDSRRNFKEKLSRILINYKQASDSNLRGKDKKLTNKARAARKNLAYTSHMVGGVKRDSALNKKVLGENRVIVGSHMQPIVEATRGIIDFESDDLAVESGEPSSPWEVKLSPGGTTLGLTHRDSSRGISLGTKRKKHEGGKRATNTSVFINEESQVEDATIDRTLGPEEVKDSLMITFLKGQAKLVEQLLANQ